MVMVHNGSREQSCGNGSNMEYGTMVVTGNSHMESSRREQSYGNGSNGIVVVGSNST